MKKFMQRLGIIAASGLLFGGLAGLGFSGVKTGLQYATETVSSYMGKENDKSTEQTDGNKSTVQIGGNQSVQVSMDENSQLYNVADLAEQVMPSIVSITSTTIYENPYAYFYGGSTERTVTGAGSGVIIGEDDSRLLIATNNHVVEGTESLTVGFSDGTDASAVIVGTDVGNDLAVVAVRKTDLSEDTLNTVILAALGDSDTTRVGEPVVAIGNALGYGQSVTVGYVSALNQKITINNSSISMIQTDAAINEGNSGGALFNLQGQLIGINSAKATNYNNNVEGMGYAIPISDAIPIIQGIIDGTSSQVTVGTAYMGIQGRDLSQYDAASFKMPQGVYLLAVIDGAPAAQAGLQAGDIITGIDNKTVSSMSDIKEYLSERNPGDTIMVTIERSNQQNGYEEQQVSVTLGSYIE